MASPSKAIQTTTGQRRQSDIPKKKPTKERVLRVKSGCRTCKIRKVKCDEQKPACRRCLSTGRVCDGYGIWGGGGNAYGSSDRRHLKPSSSPPELYLARPMERLTTPVPLLHQVTLEEQTYFEFFCKRTALKLPGVFDSNFWESLVFQASSTEPAVLHATIALASAHKRGEKTDGTLNEHDRFALQQYNKAINELQKQMNNQDANSLRVALITCMVFITLELLRGEHKTASTHLRNGLNLLSQLQGRQDHQSAVVVRPRAESAEDDLVEAFARLNVQSALFGYGSGHLYIVAQDLKSGPDFSIPSRFSSVYESRQYMDALLNSVFDLGEQCGRLELSSSSPSHDLVRRQKLLDSSLSAWKIAYEGSLSYLRERVNPRTALGLPLLSVYSIMTRIMLDTCFTSNHEVIFDSYISSFGSIVTQAADLAKAAGLPIDFVPECRTHDIAFTVDMGFIPPLYYTALKCRHPAIRRMAMKLLLNTPHREGVWDGTMVAGIAAKVRRMEEGVFFKDLGMDPDEEFSRLTGEIEGSRADDGAPSLPEASRFHDVKVAMSDDVKGVGTLICGRWRHEGDGGWEKQEVGFVFDGATVT